MRNKFHHICANKIGRIILDKWIESYNYKKNENKILFRSPDAAILCHKFVGI